MAEVDTVFPTTPPPFRPDITLTTLRKLANLNPEFLYYSHFGCVSNAVTRLSHYEEQIRHWLRIVRKSVKMEESASMTRERILAEDKTIQRAISVLQNNPVHKKALIENSVQGFVEFVISSSLLPQS